MTAPRVGWQVHSKPGSVAALHDEPFPERPEPTVWMMQPDGAALVLGSGQRDRDLDAVSAASGYPTCRRRSGGGAVLIEPEDSWWIDVFIPAGSDQWSTDLGRTFLTIGQWWVDALAGLGVTGELIQARPVRSPLTDAVCFAGQGWGEVMIDDQKVVGLSQRRTRWGARVQCLVVRRSHIHAAATALGESALAGPDVPDDAVIDAVDAVWPDIPKAFLHRLAP